MIMFALGLAAGLLLGAGFVLVSFSVAVLNIGNKL